ncbi:ectoine/hydroxyectoine ABC transporter permease subunit EhuC [Ilumatobacter nonamiensis]|uniref:ectoine/hydroxyectoine ABC transporter permease subunit EhuC n=1 Tax=Ilumatobacter nonamiensis TaxID=467093 RepID=UPI000348618A|nr:ectoine/hydroxyectoine ABC transporter permease subunit EhuC [Ilumatobacter nonamiensis]
MNDFFLNSTQYERLWDGTLVTLQVLALSFMLGIVLSVGFGVARLSERVAVRAAALVYVEVARGISSIVLLFWMAFALPILLGFDQPSRLLMGSVALGLNMGGYGAEIVRGAIQSVPKGQTEASIALNLTPTQRIRHIVLPQAMPVILPPMGNLTIEILKGTALVSLIGLSDLTFEVSKLRVNRTISDDPVSIPILFLNALIIYFVLAQIIALLFRLAERRVNAGFEQRSGRTAVELSAPTAGVTG